ncbi:MAG: hypothetical protein AB8C84_13285 [Oligoflexales bacterium]
MNIKIKLIFTFYLSFFSTFIFSESEQCTLKYPTVWKVQNSTAQTQYLHCRVYYGGWSYQSSREIHIKISPDSQIEHHFPDHNDSLGMVQRNWSCAYSHIPNALNHETSATFKFKGCPDSTMTLSLDSSVIAANKDQTLYQALNNSDTAPLYCPNIQSIQRDYKCTSSLCTWDQYSFESWSGTTEPLSKEELMEYKFVGVDAHQETSQIQGCIYESRSGKSNLILTSHQNPIPGRYPKLNYKAYQDRDFSRQAGHLKQCLSEDRFQCPLQHL